MASVISGDANVSATEFGYLDGVTSALQTQLDAKLNLAGGKILQIVRATDSTNRSTTSTSAVDASISVTISPTKSDSALILLWSFSWRGSASVDSTYVYFQITDSSNNAISGAEKNEGGASFTGTGTRYTSAPAVLVAYATPATTSAVTYKGRFFVDPSVTNTILNGVNTGQLYAIEVSA